MKADLTEWSFTVKAKMPATPITPPEHTFKVSVTIDAPNVPDGDYTEDFFEAGTTFKPTGAMTTDRPIPVERGWVKDGKLTVEGTVQWSGA